MAGPDLEGQVQVRKKCPRPGPDRTSDSLPASKVVQKEVLGNFDVESTRVCWSLLESAGVGGGV